METPLASVAVATITLARTEEESETLRQSLSELERLAVPVFIVDGGSVPSLLHYLESVRSFRLAPQAHRGVQAQAWASVQAAFDANFEWLVYSEPDKQRFFTDHLQAFVQKACAMENGLVLASRNANAFQTFPAFQQTTEACINDCCAEALGLQTDYCYGPFALHRKVWKGLTKPVEDVGWGWRPYVFAGAKPSGLNTAVFEGDFECPPAQRNDDVDERLYRMKQLEQNIRGLVLGLGR